jgi:hypothetical protein
MDNICICIFVLCTDSYCTHRWGADISSCRCNRASRRFELRVKMYYSTNLLLFAYYKEGYWNLYVWRITAGASFKDSRLRWLRGVWLDLMSSTINCTVFKLRCIDLQEHFWQIHQVPCRSLYLFSDNMYLRTLNPLCALIHITPSLDSAILRTN